MNLVKAFILIPFLGLLFFPFLRVKGKAVIIFSIVLLNAVVSGYFAVQSLLGNTFEFILPGSIITGNIPLRIDAISGWFILIINFVFLTGSFYGIFYMKAYKGQRNNINLHGIAFVFLHAAIVSLCVIQNGLVFLIAWEIMALCAFVTIIFEHEKMATIQAGINYLIQSHIAIIFLMLGFIWVAYKTGSYDFNAITVYTMNNQGAAAILLFLCFFVAFAIKAGFVPFHTWLPYAHPAAPSHISGIMSGVLIKIGIFGIFRMLLLIKTDYTTIGYVILVFSLISGLYGVMLAIVQHNLKKLLAYHSIENIGIIGIGIGIGCIGYGSGNIVLATLGFAGALLHTLNHALFKSLLFYTAGNVYQATHTINIEHLGGLIKKMPQTAFLFLIAAIAICGIPPFNGFISEILIYNGLYYWLQDSVLVSLIAIIFSVLALATIGGLAMLCFTKAFGVVFLGNARHKFPHEIKEAPFIQLIPLYIIVLFIVLIGIVPQIFLKILSQPVNLMVGNKHIFSTIFQGKSFEAMQTISWTSWGFILLVAALFFLRKFIMRKRTVQVSSTWGCGYAVPSSKLQYTASSFVRSYSKLFKIGLLFVKKEKEIHGIFPSKGHYETHAFDQIEKWLIDAPLRAYKSLMNRFLFLNNGRLQVYILYGILFIVSVISIPLIYQKIITLIGYFKQL